MLTQNYWTNKVDYKINGSEILKDYDLIKIEIPKNKNKLEADYSKIWNLLKKNINVLAYYKSVFHIYLLTEKREIYKLEDNDDLEKLNCDIKLVDNQNINKISPYFLINILLVLYGTSGNMFTLGNFQNGCFVIHKIEKSKVITLKFSVDKNSLLSLNVSTFTKIKCTKFNSNKYIFYCLEGNRLIRVINPLDTSSDLFIQKSSYKKSSINFINYEDDFLNSKVGYLGLFLEGINNRLSKYLTFELKEEIFIQHETYLNKGKRVKELTKLIKEAFLKNKYIQLFDYENKLSNEYKVEIISKIDNFFDKKIEAMFVDKINHHIPTFIFLHEKSEYENNNDPYLDLKKRYKLTQVISYKNCKTILNENNILFEAILKELLIKNEICKSSFYLSSKWKSFKDFEFFVPIDCKNDSEDTCWEKIIIDNNINIVNIDLFDRFKINRIQELKDNLENIEFIAFKNDDYFAITRTNEFILPNIKESLKIYNKFIENKDSPRLRRNEYKKFTTAGSGINYHVDNNCLTYFSSTSIDNLKRSTTKANIIRKVYFSDKNFDCIAYLNSLDEYFVRNKELTVLPFILKYLREFLKINL
ncbi:hypothetical protein NG774_10390 [Aliarcobacter cryaerophilus]|uniref:hypothetical protein n=1 Tax=Aliarcobacter cryaerophilus TaxID=28198 RepID=UPI003DA48D4D